MVNALLRLGRLKGVQRPALCGTFPVYHGQCIVIDLGANADCRPDFLAQFAVMGSLYSQKIYGVEKPRVGILSNGEEAGKGNQLVRDSFPLVAASGVNFIGNIEPKDMFGGGADVVVCDGFTGNILLKSSEAAARLLTTLLKEKLKSGALSMAGGLLAKPAFDELKRVMDPSEYGAAPLLGVDGLVFIGHGRSDAKALVSAIRVARQAVQADLIGALRGSLQATLTGLSA
jgi:glycerol-3-phosphate acyltransferase PlsX